jgi:non-canonical poly(A) RNA polymerase PAPD5/7
VAADELEEYIVVNEKKSVVEAQERGDGNAPEKNEAYGAQLSWREVTPWLNKNIFKMRSPILRLHNEIIDFTNYIAPTQKEHEIRTDSVAK